MDALAKFVGVMALIIAIDIPWLFITQPYVSAMIRKIQGGDDGVLRIGSALVVYVALAYLAKLPKTATEAFLLGASVYAVFDFTNYAIFKNYDLRIAIADTLWGGVLFTLVFYALKYFSL